ncbi:MAG: O-antigen ligase family protein [Alphaproteobacteria bacterium]|nr:O-antigen ligase family protein [Alphaproteobacteria bacterium]OJV13833.1 MAG: hypothetical protein BGO27_08040 [Alphaproteobacteria bacterium 33-17]
MQLVTVFLSIAIIISVYAGLAVAPVYGIMSVLIIIKQKLWNAIKNIKIYQNTIFIVSVYLIICLAFNVNHASIKTFIATILVALMVRPLLKETINTKYVVIAFIIYVALAFIEITSKGAVTNIFRTYFTKVYRPFILDDLNRAMTFGSLLLWPLIGYLYEKSKFYSSILYIAFIMLLASSDSATSLIAAIVSGMGFYLCRFKFIQKAFIPVTILGSIAFPVIMWNISASDNIMLTVKLRLDIWQGLILHMMQNLPDFILGRGFDSSRNIYETYKVLVPLHPHNHILQIIYETGVVGLGLYFILISKLIHKYKHDHIFCSMFITYYFISLVSYGIWQSWWLAAQVFAFILYYSGKKNAV